MLSWFARLRELPSSGSHARPKPSLMTQRAADRRASVRREERLDELLALLRLDEPVVRAEVVLAARARLAGGLHPSADDLAEMLLDEIVGGRLH